MKVFASRYLEEPSSDTSVSTEKWNWTPEKSDIERIYASGNNTKSRQSTYAAESDNREDDDRPNEGFYVA